MKFAVLVCFLATVLSHLVEALPNFEHPSYQLDNEWESFKQAYGKTYTGYLERVRRLIWESNLRKIQKHNIEYDMGFHSFALGMNKFTDLTHKEFYEAHGNTGANERVVETAQEQRGFEFLSPQNMGPPPESLDWRTEGFVTEVKDQTPTCLSGWAFSAVGALEGQVFRKTKTLVALSAQQLVDCMKGCTNGKIKSAFEYIKKNKGIDTHESYPYDGKNGKCRFTKAHIGATVSGIKNVAKGDEKKLLEAVARVGPIAVNINAKDDGFKDYKSGIYNNSACQKTPTHAMLIVGYGEENNEKFWILKNSYGTSWGEEGYMRMSRGSNMCGIADGASYPAV